MQGMGMLPQATLSQKTIGVNKNPLESRDSRGSDRESEGFE
jgi:hypothetical protein